MTDHKPKYPSMRDNPKFADAYTQRDGKKFFDIQKGFDMAKKLFAKDPDSSEGKALWGRSKWGFENFKKFKQENGEWRD